jgi:ABC-type sugar transport system ATPase subunit
MSADDPVARLAAEAVSKRYPGVVALDDVSFAVEAGEVHALVGENGAGKSTLVRILSGAQRPDSGRILRDGEQVEHASPSQALRSGIATIFQEFSLVPWLTVADNIVLGREPGRGPARTFLDRRAAESKAGEVLEQLGAAVDVRARVWRLSTAEQQLVEIARALAGGSPILIMDEPTSSLAGHDSERLLDIVGRLRDRGRAILFISHRLDEVRSIADRVTVLRGGRVVSTRPVAGTDTSGLIADMIGGELDELFPARHRGAGDAVLRVRGLTRRGAFEDVGFEVRAGEIVGFAGLVGAGRTEVMRAVAGIDRFDGGTVELHGERVSIRSPVDAVARGIAYLPEDRKREGLVLPLSGSDNIALPSLRSFVRRGVLRRGRIRATAERHRQSLRIRGDLSAPVVNLSGGNQQKVVLAKWLEHDPRVLILDEPTRGIDVAAKHEVFELMRALCEKGAAIVFVSSDLGELVNVANRIVVMSGGRVEGRFDEEDFDEQRLLHAAFAAHRRHGVVDAA